MTPGPGYEHQRVLSELHVVMHDACPAELKKSRYEAAGTASYWVIDPLAPSVTAWDLSGWTYAEVGRASGDEVLVLGHPFPVTLVPSALRG